MMPFHLSTPSAARHQTTTYDNHTLIDLFPPRRLLAPKRYNHRIGTGTIHCDYVYSGLQHSRNALLVICHPLSLGDCRVPGGSASLRDLRWTLRRLQVIDEGYARDCPSREMASDVRRDSMRALREAIALLEVKEGVEAALGAGAGPGAGKVRSKGSTTEKQLEESRRRSGHETFVDSPPPYSAGDESGKDVSVGRGEKWSGKEVDVTVSQLPSSDWFAKLGGAGQALRRG